MQKPAPSCFIVHQEIPKCSGDFQVIAECCWLSRRPFHLRLSVFPMVFIPLILQLQWLLSFCASPRVCPVTWCSPGVFSEAQRVLQSWPNCWINHKRKPGEICLGLGRSRCLWIFWIRLSVESHVSAKLLKENFENLIFLLEVMRWKSHHLQFLLNCSFRYWGSSKRAAGFVTHGKCCLFANSE